jgi:hypothetical protein
MNNPYPRPSITVSRIATMVLALPVLLCLTQCAGAPPPAPLTASCGSVHCNTLNDCTNATNWPLCAKLGSAVCHTVTSECTYQLKNDVACQCLERDVRLCNVGGSPGVQICTANPARTATTWGTCAVCTTCT